MSTRLLNCILGHKVNKQRIYCCSIVHQYICQDLTCIKNDRLLINWCLMPKNDRLLINWCLMPNLAVFQLYRGVNKFYALKMDFLYTICIPGTSVIH